MKTSGLLVGFLALSAVPALAVVVPDNGFGTATVPPQTVPYVWDNTSLPWAFSNGLPPGSAVTSNPTTINGVTYGTDVAGGGLGGNRQTFTAALNFSFTGSGAMLGYSRGISIGINCVTDTASRVPFAPVQNFTMDFVQMQGQVTGDPDFDLLRVSAGSNFGMPSPGQTVLQSAGPGQWQIDSYFDIMYRIDFIGHPGGPLSGLSGSTTSVARMVIGSVPTPGTAVMLGVGGLVVTRRRRG